jgi:superfamily II DNA or RNA helicase
MNGDGDLNRNEAFAGWDAVARVLHERASQDQHFLNKSQSAAVRAIADRLRKNGVVLADEVGMGKTRIAVVVAQAVAECGGRAAILIPPGLGAQWQDEMRKAGMTGVRPILRAIDPLLEELGSEGQDRSRIRDRCVLISHNLASWRLNGPRLEWRTEVLMHLVHRAGGPNRQNEQPRLFKNDLDESRDVSISAAKRMFALTRSQVAARARLKEVVRASRKFANLRGDYGSEGELRVLYDKAIGLGLGVFDLIIIDEAHKSRNAWNKLSVLVESVLVCGDHARRLCMTATPVEIDSRQWRQSLERTGLDLSDSGPWPGIQDAIGRFVSAVEQVRRRWRTDVAARNAYERAAKALQDALDPFLVRRDKRHDDDVRRFGEYAGEAVHYRLEKPIRVQSASLDIDWKQAIFAAEALSFLRERVSDKDARARLTMGNGQGIASIFDEPSVNEEDETQAQADKEIEAPVGDVSIPNAYRQRATLQIERAQWWRRIMLAPMRAGHLYDHPGIRIAADEIDAHTARGEKVLVFGRYTEPMRALTRLLNARAMLRAFESGDSWPESVIREEMMRPLAVASRQTGVAFDATAFGTFLRDGYARLRTRREGLRRSIYSRIRNGLGPEETETSLLLKAAEDDDGGSSLLVAAMDEHLETPTGGAERTSDAEIARVFERLIDTLREKAEGDDDSNGRGKGIVGPVEAKELWGRLEPRLEEEFGGQRATFARFIYGATSQSTRRLIQLAFNRFDSAPKVLVAQSLVGREGLNLHEACRVVVLLHLEWNPGVVEQQIGRVDRVNGRWNMLLRQYGEEMLLSGRSTMSLPRIEVRPVIFEGTYDEHHWAVLSRRWDDLRAQLHGAIIPERDRLDADVEAKEIIAYLDRVSPNFDPFVREATTERIPEYGPDRMPSLDVQALSRE